MNIAFLFGSGISISSRFPSTEELSQKILNGNHILFDDRTNVFSFDKTKENSEAIKCIQEFLHILKNKIDEPEINGTKRYNLNYENLFYVLEQVLDEYTGEVSNPLTYFGSEWILDSIDQLTNNFWKIYDGLIFRSTSNDVIRKKLNLIELSLMYIKRILLSEFYNAQDNLVKSEAQKSKVKSTFSFIKQAMEFPDVKNLNCFTLNHDLLLEWYFKIENIDYGDGFKNGIFDINNLDASQNNVLLLKLHGSIDAGYDDNWKFVKENDYINHIKNNRLFYHGAPSLLIGTFNKFYAYNLDPVYLDLSYKTRQLLQSSNNLIIAGYGFQDKGINAIVRQWLDKEKNHRIIYIHNNPDNEINKARGMIKGNYDSWKKSDKVRNIEMLINEASGPQLWSEIKSNLIK